MRLTFAFLAALAAASFTGSFTSPAQADPYRWCAEYGGGHGGRNCGFVTLQQCRATISGDNRATCVLNPYFDGRPFRTP